MRPRRTHFSNTVFRLEGGNTPPVALGVIDEPLGAPPPEQQD